MSGNVPLAAKMQLFNEKFILIRLRLLITLSKQIKESSYFLGDLELNFF